MLALWKGGIRLQVPPADAEDARVVLNDQPLPQSEPILTEHERTTERALQSAAFSIAWEPFSSLFSVAAFAGV